MSQESFIHRVADRKVRPPRRYKRCPSGDCARQSLRRIALKHLNFERDLPGTLAGRREAAKDGTAAISVNIPTGWLEPLFHPRPRCNLLQQSRCDARLVGSARWRRRRSGILRERLSQAAVGRRLRRLNGYGVAHDEVPTSTVRPRSFSVRTKSLERTKARD
jgi:hypothetical protein